MASTDTRSSTERGFRQLAREPGYLRFLGAATFSRVADEMFSVGVVLLVLERTGSAALAGALVAAITLPSLLTAPLLGAWLDLRGRRKALMMLDQVVASVALVAIALFAGKAPDALMVAIAFAAGLMWPLSFGGYTSLIPVIVPEELLSRANAIEATSFNVALIAGPLLAGAIAALAGPEAAVLTEAGLTISTLPLLVGFDRLDSARSSTADRSAPLRRSCRSCGTACARSWPSRSCSARPCRGR